MNNYTCIHVMEYYYTRIFRTEVTTVSYIYEISHSSTDITALYELQIIYYVCKFINNKWLDHIYSLKKVLGVAMHLVLNVNTCKHSFNKILKVSF